MKNSEFVAMVKKELDELLAMKDNEVFGSLYNEGQTRVEIKKYIIDIARQETVKKIQSGGGVEVIKDYDSYVNRIENELKSINFKYPDIARSQVESLAYHWNGAGKLLFDDEE